MSRLGPVPPWFYRQSAVIPWRRREGRVEILMITNRKGKRWVIPKGVVEPELDPPTSAAREALEEAGIEGPVSAASVGEFSYEKWQGVCTVTVFGMKVETIHDDWEESFRERRWFEPEQAAKRCREKKLGELILKFAQSPAK